MKIPRQQTEKAPRRYIAKVIDNNDPDKEGKVQIYIEHLMSNFKTEHYPWARQDREWSSEIPEIGFYVWVYFTDEKYLKKPYYANYVDLKDHHYHDSYEDNIQTEVGSETEYPNVKYIYFPNKVCLALSSSTSTPEITLYHPSCYIFIDKQGQLTIEQSNGNKFEMLTTGISITDKNENTIVMTGTAVTINDNLVINK